jgi:hypothetical protein
MTKRLYYLLIVLLFALLPFHALVTNYVQFGLGFHFPINAWKEGIIIILTILAAFDMWKTKRTIEPDWLDVVIIIFFILGILSAIFQTRQIGRILFGFKYDFEFLWLFFIVRHGIRFSQEDIPKIVRVVLGSGIIIVLFGILQIFFLPKDFMIHFGYSPHISTWVPGGPLPMYHAIDNNALLPRVSSTLSGPNQFASYLLILLPLSIQWIVNKKSNRWLWIMFTVFIAINLFFTYSRSAYIACVLSLLVGIWLYIKNKRVVRNLLLGMIGIGIIGVVLIMMIKPAIISDIIVRTSSTQGHYERTWDGIVYSLKNPLGYGIGNAGPASSRFNADNIGWIPENWYLQIALELGFFGLILYVMILIGTMQKLFLQFSQNNDLLSLSLFLTLLAIAITSLFLHSWEETAVALTFWGITGITLQKKNLKKTKKLGSMPTTTSSRL